MKSLTLTVVIPAFNEEQLLPRAMKALQAQTDQQFELIVVDNNSTDRTAEVAQSFKAKVVHEKRPGVCFARQAGFDAAKTDLIATTDADSIVPPNWIADIRAAFKNPAVVGVGGPYTYDIEDRVVNEVVNRSIPYLHEIDRLIHADAHHLIGGNLAVRRSAFEKINGFRLDLPLGEDLDISHRLATVGKIKFLPKLRVKTSDRRFQIDGPQALIKYLNNYLELTHPTTAIRRQAEQLIDRIRANLNG